MRIRKRSIACNHPAPVDDRSSPTGSQFRQPVTDRDRLKLVTDRNQLRSFRSSNFYAPVFKTKGTRYPQISGNLRFVSVNRDDSIRSAGLTLEGSHAFRVRDRSGKPASDGLTPGPAPKERGAKRQTSLPECGLAADSPTALLLSAGTPKITRSYSRRCATVSSTSCA